MTEATHVDVDSPASPAKFKLPRKAVQITYREGEVGIFDSVKAAADASGLGSGVITRLAATGEADGNGDTYKLVDYVPRRGTVVSVSFDDKTYAELTAAALAAKKKVGVYVRDIIENTFVG